MLSTVLYFLTNIIKYTYIYLALHILNNKTCRFKHLLISTAFYNVCCVILKDDNYKTYIMQCLFTLMYFYLLVRDAKKDRKEILPWICAFLISYEIVNMISNCISSVIVLFISFSSELVQNLLILISVLLKCLIVSGILSFIKRYNSKLIISIKRGYLVYITYLLIVCIKIPFLYADIKDVREWKIGLLSIACCTAIFFIISQIDKHNAAKEKAKVEESNKLLAAKLHKSQEILPAMVQVLSDVTEKNGAEMEERKAHELLEEVSHLYEQQLKENGKEDLQLKSFKSTGLTMLDKQLIVYQREAVDKEINLDIFVQAPINDVIWKGGIDQLRLQRAVGDLIRNSFQAVRKEQEKIKHVLLIVGCRQEDILEIAVMDNGVEIPLHVLETFGKRGVTTGGTGNGLADIWEFVQDAKASLRVDEFEGTADLFTKKISIIFDKKHICYLNSSRSKNVNGFFWNNKINE